MKASRYLLPLFAVALLALTSCEDTPTNPGDKKATLTANAWKTLTFTVDGVDDPTAPTKQVFNADGTYSATISGATVPGTWSLNVDETGITITTVGVAVDWSIISLTSTSLHLKYTKPGGIIVDYTGEPE